MTLKTIALSAALTLTASISFAGGMVDGVKSMDTASGMVLTDSSGMTQYTFDKDSGGKSMCNGGCAANWPPLMAPAGAVDHDGFTLITRDDGSMQWAHDGWPLYGWVNDQAAGDITGDGVGGVWHLARP
jgi:predicted lipoprotein with Yx(FWY)xxD motif